MKKRRTKKKTKTKTRKGPRPLGKVTHYFDKINVAVIKIASSLKVGDSITVRTRNGEFTQPVESLQVNHKNILGARKGSEVGLKTIQKVKAGDLVFKAKHPQTEIIEKVEYRPLWLPKVQKPISAPEKKIPSQPKQVSFRNISFPPPSQEPKPQAEPQKKKPSGYGDIKFFKF